VLTHTHAADQGEFPYGRNFPNPFDCECSNFNVAAIAFDECEYRRHYLCEDRTNGLLAMPLNQEVLVQAAQNVPPLPQSVVKLLSLYADPDYEIRDVVRAVELDPSLCFKLLRLANSAAHSGTIRTTAEAVVRLGAETVQSLSLVEIARPRQSADLSPFGLTPNSYWRHCVAVVAFAEAMNAERRRRFGGGLSVAAILHDFGKLVIAEHLTSDDAHLLIQRDAEESPVAVEDQVLTTNHAQVGGLVAEAWALPSDLVLAVRYHHEPDAVSSAMCHALNIANQLAWTLEQRTVDLDRENESRQSSLLALGYSDTDWQSLFRAGETRYHATLEFYC